MHIVCKWQLKIFVNISWVSLKLIQYISYTNFLTLKRGRDWVGKKYNGHYLVLACLVSGGWICGHLSSKTRIIWLLCPATVARYSFWRYLRKNPPMRRSLTVRTGPSKLSQRLILLAVLGGRQVMEIIPIYRHMRKQVGSVKAC